MIKIILIITAVCVFAKAKAPAELFDPAFEKTFVSKKMTLNEAKRLRILANAQLSGLNEESPQKRILDTHKLLMLLVELESLFPKEAKYFNSKQMLTRFYNLQLLNRTQEAEFVFIDAITKAQGPVNAIEYFSRYISSIKGIEKPIFTGFAISLKCDLIAQLYITSEYEGCLEELYKISPKDSSIVETHKLNQLRYYYSTSARYMSKTSKLKTEINDFKVIQGNDTLKKYYQILHELLNSTSNSNNAAMSLEISNSFEKLDFTNNSILLFNSKRYRSILFLRLNKIDDANKELTAALSQTKLPEFINATIAQNNALLLDLFFHVHAETQEKNAFDYTQRNLISRSPICTQNLLHNSQVVILLHAAKYTGPLLKQIHDMNVECQSLVGLKNQEGYIKTLFEIIQSASKNEIDKKTALEIQNKYNSIKNNFYSISYFDLIIDELLKKY